jgi:hypothetical protein
MRRDKLLSLLNQIKALTDASLKELGSANSGQRAATSGMSKGPRISPDSLPTWILKLRSDGYFGQPRIPREVHEKLQSHYRCDVKRVGVALLRLQKGKELRKTSKLANGKKQVAYVW